MRRRDLEVEIMPAQELCGSHSQCHFVFLRLFVIGRSTKKCKTSDLFDNDYDRTKVFSERVGNGLKFCKAFCFSSIERYQSKTIWRFQSAIKRLNKSLHFSSGFLISKHIHAQYSIDTGFIPLVFTSWHREGQ